MAEIFTLTLLVIKWLIAIIVGITIVFLLWVIGSVCFNLIAVFFDKIQKNIWNNNN